MVLAKNILWCIALHTTSKGDGLYLACLKISTQFFCNFNFWSMRPKWYQSGSSCEQESANLIFVKVTGCLRSIFYTFGSFFCKLSIFMIKIHTVMQQIRPCSSLAFTATVMSDAGDPKSTTMSYAWRKDFRNALRLF